MVYTNSKKCPNCGEMTLVFNQMEMFKDFEICNVELEDEKSSCVIHKCRLDENHKLKGGELDGLHECICGCVWRDGGHYEVSGPPSNCPECLQDYLSGHKICTGCENDFAGWSKMWVGENNV